MRIDLEIAQRLLEERTRLGLSQIALSAHGGVTKFTQINYEKGRSSPSAYYLAQVAKLGFDVLYIVTGSRAPLATHRCECVLPAALLINCQTA